MEGSMVKHICSTGADLPAGDPERCGKPAVTQAKLKSGLTLFACGEQHKHDYLSILKDLEWKPLSA
jgi:hypothetical protein